MSGKYISSSGVFRVEFCLIVNKNVENLKKRVENRDEFSVNFVLTSYSHSTSREMFGSILRKKVSNDKLANVFINGLLSACQNGFPMVAEFINEDQSFAKCPEVQGEDYDEFTLIVFVGNLSFIESSFEPEQAAEVERLIYEKLAKMYQLSVFDFKRLVKDYRLLIQRLNHPSKNIIYGMSKAIFDKYTLYNFQDEYFRRMQVANPLFLKRMDEIIENFVWDWDVFFKKYKLD